MHPGQKYALNLGQDILTSEKYVLDLGQDILTSEKYALDLGHVYAPRAEICPESRTRFYPLGRSMNQIQGKVSPPGDGLPEISGIKKRVRNGSI